MVCACRCCVFAGCMLCGNACRQGMSPQTDCVSGLHSYGRKTGCVYQGVSVIHSLCWCGMLWLCSRKAAAQASSGRKRSQDSTFCYNALDHSLHGAVCVVDTQSHWACRHIHTLATPPNQRQSNSASSPLVWHLADTSTANLRQHDNKPACKHSAGAPGLQQQPWVGHSYTTRATTIVNSTATDDKNTS